MRKESEKFKVMLEHYLPKFGFKDLKKLSVLNVACGRCNEAEVLIELFGKVQGIDNNAKKIKRIKKNNFKVGDAINLSKVFDEKFDLVIVRHPNIFGEDWKRIYRECYKVTLRNKVLISTFYTKKEYLRGKLLIKNAGYKVEVAKENQFYVKLLGFDKYVLICRKINEKNWFKKLFS